MLWSLRLGLGFGRPNCAIRKVLPGSMEALLGKYEALDLGFGLDYEVN